MSETKLEIMTANRLSTQVYEPKVWVMRHITKVHANIENSMLTKMCLSLITI